MPEGSGAEPYVQAHCEPCAAADHVVSPGQHHGHIAPQSVRERQAHEMRGVLPLGPERAADIGGEDLELCPPAFGHITVLVG